MLCIKWLIDIFYITKIPVSISWVGFFLHLIFVKHVQPYVMQIYTLCLFLSLNEYVFFQMSNCKSQAIDCIIAVDIPEVNDLVIKMFES